MLRGARAVLLIVALLPAPAGATTVTRVGVWPSRAAAAAAVQARLDRLARALGLTAPAPARLALAGMVQRAETLASAGRLDEAAALLDVALDEGTRAPLALSDPPALVRAAVSRATIALARGEHERAERLLALLLRYDPSFVLLPGEDTPRMRAAVARVQPRAGAAPPLLREDLGEACADETLLTARRLDATTSEIVRYEGCRPVASVRASDAADDAALVTALGGTVAAQPPTPAPGRPRPVYRRAWFWGVTVGGALLLAGAGVAAWALTRGDEAADSSWHVTPRF